MRRGRGWWHEELTDFWANPKRQPSDETREAAYTALKRIDTLHHIIVGIAGVALLALVAAGAVGLG